MNKDIWKGWAHNLDYCLTDRKFSEAVKRMPESVKKTSFILDMFSMFHQKKSGVTYVVEKQVSDELLNSSVGNVKFSDIMWPSTSIELYFEDLSIPSMLLQQVDDTVIKQMSGASGVKLDKASWGNGMASIWIFTQSNDRSLRSFQSEKNMNEWLMETNSEAESLQFDAQSTEESSALRELSMLAYKVLIYSAVTQLAPKRVHPLSLNHGGKPGVKGRPDRPIYRVVDLPKVYRESKQASVKKASTKAFRGRHGHFHHYRSDFFVNKQGTFEYWPPVLGPDGTLPKIKYRVRKPKV